MSKIVTFIILVSILSFAEKTDVFKSKLSLQPSPKNLYGHWSLEYINAKKIDNQPYRREIIEQSDRAAPYRLSDSNIEIFQKGLYKNRFLKEGYYRLEWRNRKGSMGDEVWRVSQSTIDFLKESEFYKNYHAQDGWERKDWSILLADYLNSSIKTLPTYELHITNQSNQELSLLELYAKTIFTSIEEEASTAEHFPTKSKVNYFPLHWNHKKMLKFKKSISIKPKASVAVPLSIIVTNASEGVGGSSRLTVGLFIRYRVGKKYKESFLTVLSQSEDYGYQTGW